MIRISDEDYIRASSVDMISCYRLENRYYLKLFLKGETMTYNFKSKQQRQEIVDAILQASECKI